MKVSIIGLDIAKSSFHAYGVDTNGTCIFKRKLGRNEVSAFFEKFAPYNIVMEACGPVHYWARVIKSAGHDVRLLLPDRIKPYVKKAKRMMPWMRLQSALLQPILTRCLFRSRAKSSRVYYLYTPPVLFSSYSRQCWITRYVLLHPSLI